MNPMVMTKFELSKLLKEAQRLLRHGKYAGAEERAKAVLDFLGKKQSQQSALASNIMADCLWRTSRLNDAMQCAATALEAAKEVADQEQIGYAFANLGTIHRELSFYAETLEYYHTALDIYRALEKPQESAHILMNIGNVLRQLMQFEEADSYLREAEAKAKEAGLHLDVARVLNVRGLLCDDLSQMQDALEFYRRSLEIFHAEGDNAGNYLSMAWLFKNIGNAYSHLGLYDEAQSFFGNALEYFIKSGNLLGAAAAQGGMGELYATKEWKNADPRRAMQLLGEALATLEELGDKHVRYKCHRSLAELHQQQGNWREAVMHFKAFYELEQEVQNDTARKRAAADAYERRIAELRKEQEIAARYTDTIRKQLEIIQRDLRTAEKIQQSILPNVAVETAHIREAWDIAAKMTAARNVGGDFYDLFRLDDHRIGLVVADVSGKGMAAALFMVISRTMLKLQAFASADPGEVVRKANEMLCGENVLSMFVTMFYAVLDTRTGVVQFANAGHNPPFVVRADGTIERIDYGSSMIMAIHETAEFPTDQIILNKGDYLFCYTDGVTEALSESQELYSEERLEPWLRGLLANAPLSNHINNLIGELLEYSGAGGQTDDITIVLLHRK